MASINDIRKQFVVDNKEEIKPKQETVVAKQDNENIEISKLVSFRKQQPFSLYDDNKKNEMKESIKENGVLYPIIVRKIENDKYEIISGHNRVECSKELGLLTIPAKIVDCDDDKATLIMLETNLCNRDKIPPIEKGYAYKLKFEILKKLGKASNMKDLIDYSPEGNEEKTQIYRYIRLTELIKKLQIKVNEEQISIKAGVELSYLSKENQEIVNTVLEDEQIKITVPQAQKIRYKKGDINYESVLKILKNEKAKVEKFTGRLEKRAIKIYKDKFNSDKEFTDLIIELLNNYFGATANS